MQKLSPPWKDEAGLVYCHIFRTIPSGECSWQIFSKAARLFHICTICGNYEVMPVLTEVPRSRGWDRDSCSNNCLGDAVRITGGGDRNKQNVCECSVPSVVSNSLRPYGLTVGSSVHGLLQARILEWVAISSFRESSWTRDQTQVSWISCIGRRVLNPLSHLRSPKGRIVRGKKIRVKYGFSQRLTSVWPHTDFAI